MKKYLKQLLISIMTLSMILQPIYVKAEEQKIVTLGADLSDEQRELILNYLGVDTNEVYIITVTNEDEHNLLDNYVDSSRIGKRTYSCAYIELTEAGGIHVKTVNLNWVTGDMIRNALVTSGISNCNVVAVAPFEVSGTGSIAGIFKAYEALSGEELSEDKKEIASEELVTTSELAEDIGQEEASNLISELKEQILENSLTDENSIAQYIEDYIQKNNIEITEEQKWKLVELLLKISKQDYDIEEIKQQYKDVKQTISEIKEATEKTLNILKKIVNWITELWQKITGTYDEVKQTEEYQAITEQLGILLETNDSLLGNSTIVTTTVDEDTLESIEENTSTEETTESNSNITFDNVEQQETEEETDGQAEAEDEAPGILKYVTFDFLNKTSSDAEVNNDDISIKSFDELTNQ
jgi:uncharacterized protein YpuA (DUF1002 family)